LWLIVFTWYMYIMLDTWWYIWPDCTPDCSTDWLYYCPFIFCMLFSTDWLYYCHHDACTMLIDIYCTILSSYYHIIHVIFLIQYNFMIVSYIITRYMHVHLLLYSYTLNGSSDSLDLHIQVFACYLTDQVFGEDHRHLEEPWVFAFNYWYSYFLLFYCFLDSRHIGLIAYFILLFIWDHVWTLYVLL